MSTFNALSLRSLFLCWLLLAIPTAPAGDENPSGDSRSARTDVVVVVDSLFAAAAYDSVMAIIPTALDGAWARGDSSLVAWLLVIRGRVELTKGNAEGAEQTLDLARHLAEAARDTARWSDALGFKSIATTFRGKYQESVELNQTRLKLARLTRDRISEAWARTAMAYVYLRTGDYQLARPEYEAAADLFRAENRLREELTPLVGLGRVLMALQETDAARDSYHRVWRTALELGDLRQEAFAVNNLGTWEFQYGDMSVAARYFERAYELHARAGDLRGTIIPATNIALARMYLGQYADAASILSRAIRTCEEGGYEDLVWTVMCRFANVRMLQHRANESRSLYRRALSSGRSTLTKKQRQEATYGLARALVAVDSTQTAVVVLNDGLNDEPTQEFEIVMRAFMSKCLRRLERNDEALSHAMAAARLAEDYGAFDQSLFSAFELSAAYEAAGNDAESYAWYLRCVDALDEFRLSTEEHQWREAHGRIRDVVDGGFVCLKYPADDPRSKRVEELFNIIQRFKARTLTERITEPRMQTGKASGLVGLPHTSLKELQVEVLRPDEVFLDFAVGEETAYLFAITRDSCRVVTLPGRNSPLRAKVAFYVETIGRAPSGERGGIEGRGRDTGPSGEQAATDVGVREIGQMGESLYQLLLRRVDDLIRPASRVLIAPDSYLGSVPFGTLVPPESEGGGALLLTKDIHQVPSATVLKWLRLPVGDDRRPAVGAPRLLAVVPEGSEELKGVAREVDALRNRLSGVEVLRGKPAAAAFNDTARTCEVIHVAAHVVVNDEKPWHSGLLLEPAAADAAPAAATPARTTEADPAAVPVRGVPDVAPPAPRDPYLRAGEIAARRVRARLVVLSGCESGLGRTSHGEGVLGLTSAFLSAGVPSLVATLWPVDDAVTADLMTAFYDRLVDGETAASALRGAQLEIREGESTRHPFYWAGFVVVGDGDIEVDIERSRPLSTTILLAAGLLILLIGLVLLRASLRPRKKSRDAV
jgi:CHAT domain-containing protein/tetratricopeptide (TPR) repeat protein